MDSEEGVDEANVSLMRDLSPLGIREEILMSSIDLGVCWTMRLPAGSRLVTTLGIVWSKSAWRKRRSLRKSWSQISSLLDRSVTSIGTSTSHSNAEG